MNNQAYILSTISKAIVNAAVMQKCTPLTAYLQLHAGALHKCSVHKKFVFE